MAATIVMPTPIKKCEVHCVGLTVKKGVCGGTRPRKGAYLCPATCNICDHRNYCKSHWKKAHPGYVEPAVEAKPKKERAAVPDEERCEHLTKDGAGPRCKQRAYGVVNGLRSCSVSHGGPKKPAGFVTSKAKSKPSPAETVPLSALVFFGKVIATRSIQDPAVDDAINWLEEYIFFHADGPPTQQTYLDHFAKLNDPEKKCLNFLVDMLGRENMNWLLMHLKHLSSVDDPVNKEAVEAVWRSIATDLKIPLTPPTGEPEAKKAVESAQTSTGRTDAHERINKFKAKQAAQPDGTRTNAAMAKLMTMKQVMADADE